MPDRIIIWTEDAGMAKDAREKLRTSHPGTSVVTMNPRFYPGTPGGVYAATLVCVGPDARRLVTDYEAAGVGVVMLGQAATETAPATGTGPQSAPRRRQRSGAPGAHLALGADPQPGASGRNTEDESE